jgi:hypothetical protein
MFPLTAVYIEVDADPGDLIIRLFVDAESEYRTFWVTGRVLLEQVARICLEHHMDQMADDRAKEVSVEKPSVEKPKKAA